MPSRTEQRCALTATQGGNLATAATHAGAHARPTRSLPGRRYEHLFFSGMAVLLLATAFAGFAPTYYLAGIFRAPLPSTIIHVHGAVFSCWILLLITQTSLVSTGRVDIHRRLGIAGVALAGIMVIVGVLAATDALARGFRLAGTPWRFISSP